MVEWFNRVPHGTIFLGELSIVFVILFYAVLLTVTFGGPRLSTWFATTKRDPIRVPLWTGLLVGLGYVLGSQFERVAEFIDPAAKATLAAIVAKATLAAIVAWYAWRVIRHRGSTRKASP